MATTGLSGLPEQVSAAKLAWLGDAIFSEFIRGRLLMESDRNMHRLQQMANRFVAAQGQAIVWHWLEPILQEEELTVAKWGRNVNSRPPRNAKVNDYRLATGLEALLGYLHWRQDNTRLKYLLDYIWQQRGRLL